MPGGHAWGRAAGRVWRGRRRAAAVRDLLERNIPAPPSPGTGRRLGPRYNRARSGPGARSAPRPPRPLAPALSLLFFSFSPSLSLIIMIGNLLRVGLSLRGNRGREIPGYEPVPPLPGRGGEGSALLRGLRRVERSRGRLCLTGLVIVNRNSDNTFTNIRCLLLLLYHYYCC